MALLHRKHADAAGIVARINSLAPTDWRIGGIEGYYGRARSQMKSRKMTCDSAACFSEARSILFGDDTAIGRARMSKKKGESVLLTPPQCDNDAHVTATASLDRRICVSRGQPRREAGDVVRDAGRR